MQKRKPGQPHKGWKSAARAKVIRPKLTAEHEGFRIAYIREDVFGGPEFPEDQGPHMRKEEE